MVTEFLQVDGGRIAYDVAGDGPLVVLSHGMGDTRSCWRFLTPQLMKAGYRVATPDLRGIGESSVGFSTYSRTATAADLAAIIRTSAVLQSSSATPTPEVRRRSLRAANLTSCLGSSNSSHLRVLRESIWAA